MRNGHKGRMACGILELMLGVGLILYICLADRQRIGLAAVAAVVVTLVQQQWDGGTCDLLYRCNGGSGEA